MNDNESEIELSTYDQFDRSTWGEENNSSAPSTEAERMIDDYEERLRDLRRGILPDSIIDRQFDVFESNQIGDPFKAVRRTSRFFYNYHQNQPTVENLEEVRRNRQFIQQSAKSFLESSKFLYEKTQRLYGAQSEFQPLLSGYVPDQGGQMYYDPVLGRNQLSSGFVSRAGLEEFTRMFASGDTVKMSMFQFQQQDVLAQVVNQPNTSWEIATQKLTFPGLSSERENLSDDEISSNERSNRKLIKDNVSILAGNELSMEVSELLADQNRTNMYGVRSIGSFHPKVGYVTTEGAIEGDGQTTAFFGTQNITPALTGRNTIEAMLMFNDSVYDKTVIEGMTQRGGPFFVPGVTREEQELLLLRRRGQLGSVKIAKQIRGLTYEILTMTRGINASQRYIRPGELGGRLERKGFNNIYADQSILPRMSKILGAAYQNSSDTVVISGGELSLLFTGADYLNKDFQSLQKSALGLAQEGRLIVVGQESTLKNILKARSSGGANRLFDLLSSKGNFRLSAQGTLHEKTTAVFNASGELQSLTTGSANYTEFAMLPLRNLFKSKGTAAQEKAKAFGKIFRGAGASAISQMMKGTLNTEVMLSLGKGVYKNESADPDEGDDALLQMYDSMGAVSRHYATLLGARDMSAESLLSSNNFLDKGLIAERRTAPGVATSSEGISKLKTDIEKFMRGLDDKSLRKTVSISERYGTTPEGELGVVGLKVRIGTKGSLGLHKVDLNLTVNQEGSVILSDSNRVITGSLYVNQSNIERKLVSGEVLKQGESAELTAQQTATSLIYTISETLNKNAEYSLVQDALDSVVQNTGTTEIERFLAQSITSGLVINGRENPNLSLREINNLLRDKRYSTQISQAINIARDRLISGIHNSDSRTFNAINRLSPEARERRSAVITNSFNQILNTTVPDRDRRVLRAVLSLQRNLLHKQGGVTDMEALHDLKAAIVMQKNAQALQLRSAAKAQSKTLVDLLIAPFLQPHGLGHSGIQAAARLPVFGDYRDDRPNTDIGILNPLNVKASTSLGIGKEGKYLRLIGAVSYGERMNVPGFLGIRDLRTIDTGLNSGAVTVYNTEKIARGLSGLGYLNRKEIEAAFTQVSELSKQASLSTENVDEMIRRFASMYSYTDEDLENGIMFTPYNKLEQVVQRFKNAMGSRATFDVNMNLIRNLKNLRRANDVTQELEAGGLSQGRLLNYLPDTLFKELRGEIAEFSKRNGRAPTLEEIQSLYRARDIDPYSTKRGFIGGTGLRRVAMSAGLSLMGDFSYINPEYDQMYGATSVMSIKYSASGASDPLSTQYELASMFEKGAFMLGRAAVVGENELRDYGFILPDDALARTTEEFLGERLLTLQEEGYENLSKKFFESFFVGKDKNGRTALMMREGLYVREGDSYLRRGDLDDSGRVITVSVGRDLPTGRVHEKLTVGFSGFTHRYEDGITFIYGRPTVSQNGTTVSMQMDAATFKTAQTGSRGAGKAELIKGPFQMLGRNVWNYIDGVFSKNAGTSGHRELLPTYIQEDLEAPEKTSRSQLFGMYSFNTFKGFSYAAGFSMVADNVARDNLKRATGLEIAKSLSLAMMGADNDDDIKSSLVNKLRDEGSVHLAESVKISDTKDYSKLGMGMISIGLEAFGGAKSLVKEALQTQDAKRAIAAQNKLSEVYGSLLDKSVSTENSIAIRTETGETVYTLNENDPVTKTAAFISNLIFVGRQVFNPDLVHAGAADRTLADIGKLSSRADEYIKSQGFRTRVGVLADRMRLNLPKLEDLQNGKGRRSLLRALRRMDAVLEHNYLIEYVVDTTVSRSLTPTGSKDDVPLEYQYLVGAPADYFRRFQSRYGKGVDRAKEIQNTYAVLMSSGHLGTPQGQGLEYRIALPAPIGVNANETAKRGFMSSQMDYANRYATSFVSLGIQFQTLEQMEIANRLAVSSYGRDKEVLRERASAIQNVGSNHPGSETLIDLPFLNFVDEFNTNSIGRAQQQMIKQYFVGTDKENSDRVMSMVVDGYTKAAKSYYESKVGQSGVTFTEFINSKGMYSEEGSEGIRGLEQRFRVAEQLESGSGLFKPMAIKTREKDGVKRRYFDENETAKRIRRAVVKKSNDSLAKLQENNNLQSEERFMQGLYDLEEKIVSDMKLITKYGEEYTTVDRSVVPLQDADPLSYSGLSEMLSEIQTAKQIILPAFDGFLNPETNKVHVQFHSVQEKAPVQGLLYGTSEIRNLALSFPGFQSNHLKNQMILRQKLALYGGTDGLLRKVANGGELSQAEYAELEEMKRLIEQTGEDASTFAETNIIRKAHGDQMGFKGFVGIAVNSLALDANQMILGERARSTSRNLHGLAVINNQVRRIQNANSTTKFESELDSLKTMLRLYGTDDQDYLNQAEINENERVATTSDIEEVSRKLNTMSVERSSLPLRKERTKEQVAHADKLTHQIKASRRELEVKIYSFATGVSEQKILKEDNFSKLRRMINMPEGSARRSGAPSLSTMHTNAQNIYQVLMPNQYNDILRSNQSMLELDIAQSETAMILPTVGRSLTMLGDYDGDSYQFISSTSGFHLSEVNALDQKIKTINDRIRFKSRALKDNPSKKIKIDEHIVSEEIRHLEDELRHYESEREDLLGVLSGYGGSGFFARQQAMLKDVKEWSGHFLALPKFMTQDEGPGSLTDAQAIGMVQWMRVLFPSLDDNETTLEAAKKNSKIVGNMVERALRGGFLDKSQLEGGEKSRHEAEALMKKMNENSKDHISKDDANLIISLRNELALDQNSMTPQEIKDKIDNWYIGKVASTSVMFNTFNKTVGRAAGNALSNNEQDSLQSIFGEAGSKLIGQVYNSFSPLIDSAIKANSMDYMLKSKEFRSAAKQALLSVGSNQDWIDQSESRLIIRKLGLDDDDEAVIARTEAAEKYKGQFFGVTSTLGTLQQSVRDALKFKTDQGMREMLKSEDIAKRLADAEGGSEAERNRNRSAILRQFIMEKMGPQIEVDPRSPFADNLGSLSIGGDSYVRHDMGFSGFGAMLSLYEFSQTENDRMEELFASNSVYEELYAEVSEKTGMDKVQFVSEMLTDMIQKTQASFIVDTIKGESSQFVERSLEYYEANKDGRGHDEYTKEVLDLTRKYKQAEAEMAAKGQSSSIVNLQKDYMQAMILTELKSRPGFDKDTILTLREQNQATLAYRSGASEYQETDIEKRIHHTHMVTVANRRGQQPSLQDQTIVMLDTLNNIKELQAVSEDMGPDTAGYANMLSWISTDLQGGPLTEREANIFARAVIENVPTSVESQDTGSTSVIDIMKKNVTALNQMLSIQDTKNEIAKNVYGEMQPDGTYTDSQLDRIDQLDETINAHIKRDADANRLTQDAVNLLNGDIDIEVDRAIRDQHDIVKKKMTGEAKTSIFQHDPKMEIIGALIAPLALGLMTEMPSFDDRLGSAAFDVLQSMAHMNTVDERFTTQMLTEQERVSNVARYAQAGRIRDLAAQEGMVIGGIQASLQEMLFQQTSRMAYGVIDQTLNKTRTGKITGMRAAGIMAAETISTTISLSLSKRLASGALSKNPVEAILPDYASEMLSSFTDYIWNKAEESLLANLDPDVEVMDGEINESMDFNYTAAPNELTADIDSGMVVIDEQGQRMQTEYEGHEFASMISGASSIDLSPANALSASEYSG